MPIEGKTEIASLVCKFRKRSKRLKISAILALALILVSLGAGLTIFVLADSIARFQSNTALVLLGNNIKGLNNTFYSIVNKLNTFSLETKKSNEILSSLIDSENKWISRYSKDLNLFLYNTDISINKHKRGLRKLLTKPELADLNREGVARLEELQDVIQTVSKRIPQTFDAIESALIENEPAINAGTRALERAEITLVSLNETFQKILTISKNAEDHIRTILDSQSSDTPSDGSRNYEIIISSLATKIGSMFILMFLVQILVSLYRYNIRLSYYYDARADTLELTGISDATQLEKFIEILSPEKLDFGKQQKSPTDYGFELAKDWIGKVGTQNKNPG